MIGATILMLLGLGFVLAEVFFPSLGMLAVMAAACFLIADMTAFEAGGQIAGWAFIVLQVVLIPVSIRFAFRVLPSLPFGRRMLLQQPEDPGAGLPDLTGLLGHEGVAETELRPSGRARFGEERHSVISRSGIIAQGAAIVAVSVEGSEIQVRAVDDPSDGAAPKES